MNDLSCLAYEPCILRHGPMYENPWNDYKIRKNEQSQNMARTVYIGNVVSHEITKYESLTEAEADIGIDRSSIKYALNHSGKIKKYGIIVAETIKEIQDCFGVLYG